MGYGLYLVQEGGEPGDWKKMTGVGTGVREIRARDPSGIYRAIYIATLSDAVYVLHAFQKKTTKTPRNDIAIAKARLKALMLERNKS